MLAQAGFGEPTVLTAPGNPFDAVYLARPER